MTDTQLFTQIASLPTHLKKEVEDFVTLLKEKTKGEKKIKERKFGYAKGFFKVSPDFDQPLDDFKEYT